MLTTYSEASENQGLGTASRPVVTPLNVHKPPAHFFRFFYFGNISGEPAVCCVVSLLCLQPAVCRVVFPPVYATSHAVLIIPFRQSVRPPSGPDTNPDGELYEEEPEDDDEPNDEAQKLFDQIMQFQSILPPIHPKVVFRWVLCRQHLCPLPLP